MFIHKSPVGAMLVGLILGMASAVSAAWSPVWWDNTGGNPNGVWQADQMLSAGDVPSAFSRMTWSANGWWQGSSLYGGHPTLQSTGSGITLTYDAAGSGYFGALSFIAPAAETYQILGSVDFSGGDQRLDVIISKFNAGSWTRDEVVFTNGSGDHYITLSSGNTVQYVSGNLNLLNVNGVQLSAGDYITFRPWTPAYNGGPAFSGYAGGITIDTVPEPGMLALALLGTGLLCGLRQKQ